MKNCSQNSYLPTNSVCCDRRLIRSYDEYISLALALGSLFINLLLLITNHYSIFQKTTKRIMHVSYGVVFVRELFLVNGILRYWLMDPSNHCRNDLFCQIQGMVVSYCNTFLFLLIIWQCFSTYLKAMALKIEHFQEIEEKIENSMSMALIYSATLGMPVHLMVFYVNGFGEDRGHTTTGSCLYNNCFEHSKTEIFYFAFFSSKLWEFLAFLSIMISVILVMVNCKKQPEITDRKEIQFLSELRAEYICVYALHLIHHVFRSVGYIRFLTHFISDSLVDDNNALKVWRDIQAFTDVSYSYVNLGVFLAFSATRENLITHLKKLLSNFQIDGA